MGFDTGVAQSPAPLTFRLLPPDEVADHWSDLGPILRRSTDVTQGEIGSYDLLQFLNSGMYRLLAVFNGETIIAGLVVRVVTNPHTKQLHAMFLGGTGGFFWGRDMLDMVEKLARDEGCSKVTFRGRREWARVLAPFGYEAASINYEKAVAS